MDYFSLLILASTQPQASGAAPDMAIPSGVIVDYAGAAAPAGWLLCNGAAVSRVTYAALFAAIGTTFGVGDGTTTFNVPDCRGRSPVGAGQGSGLTNRALASTGGEETHQLSAAELASHTHNYVIIAAGGGMYGVSPGTASQGLTPTSSAGNDTAHNTMHPFIALTKIIAQ